MNLTDLRTRLIALSSALALVAALACWALTGADSSRLPIVVLAGVVAALVLFAAPLFLLRASGIPLEAPVNIGIGSAAWALAIGVGCGWPTTEVVSLVIGCGVIAFLLEYARSAFARG
jgi:hypothetical protein